MDGWITRILFKTAGVTDFKRIKGLRGLVRTAESGILNGFMDYADFRFAHCLPLLETVTCSSPLSLLQGTQRDIRTITFTLLYCLQTNVSSIRENDKWQPTTR